MKFIAFFLAFLVLAQTSLPCTDEQRLEEERASCNAACPGEQTDDHTDTCSPFCVCICCATHPLTHMMQSAATLVPESSDYFPLRDITRVIDRAVPIWQPPRLN